MATRACGGTAMHDPGGRMQLVAFEKRQAKRLADGRRHGDPAAAAGCHHDDQRHHTSLWQSAAPQLLAMR
jgi:hypothetical protein